MKVLKWLALAVASVAFYVLAFRMIRVWERRAHESVRSDERRNRMHYEEEAFRKLVDAKVAEIATAEAERIEGLWKARFGVKED